MNLRVQSPRVRTAPLAFNEESPASAPLPVSGSTSSSPTSSTNAYGDSRRGDARLRQSLIQSRINEQPIPLKAGTVIEGSGALGNPTTRENVNSVSTFYPVDGDRPPPDFVKRMVLESFRRNGVTPPAGWEKNFSNYLSKDGFDPAGDSKVWTVRTYMVNGKPQRGIVVAPSQDADRSIIDSVRGFTDQKIDPAQVESMKQQFRENPDAKLDLSNYPEPVRGDYEKLAEVLQGREQAVGLAKSEWAPWTQDRVKEAREKFAGTTQEAAVKPLLDEVEGEVSRANPNLGRSVSDAGTVGALRTIAAGGYVDGQVIDTLPERASAKLSDPASREALRQTYVDLVAMNSVLDKPEQFEALRARVDTQLSRGSTLDRVLGREELAQLQAARDDLVRRRAETPVTPVTPVSRTEPVTTEAPAVNPAENAFVVSNVDTLATQAEKGENEGYTSYDADGKLDYECAQLPQRWQSDQEGFFESRNNRANRLTKNWTQGPAVTYGMNIPSGTVLASGWVDGKYLSKESGNHTLIFHKWGEQDGQKGMWVVETLHNKPQYSFRTDLERFSVVRIPQGGSR